MSRRSYLSLAVLVVCLIAGGALWFVLDPGFRRNTESVPAGSASEEAFGGKVREYLLANPEVIVEAVQLLESRRQQAELDEVQAVLVTQGDEVFRHPDSPVGGNPAGDVTVVEFFDYNCPYCRQVSPMLEDAMASDGGIRVVYKEFPILGPNSVFAAKAALAAARQGRYAEFHTAMMSAAGPADEKLVLDTAAAIGLDVQRLRSDMEDPALQAEIDRNLDIAVALKINGTPAFVVGDEVLRGATDLATLQGLVGAARQATPTPAR